MDALTSPLLQAFTAGAVAALALLYLGRHYRRCPHCRRLTPRARRGWLRCRHCGRQYHRSVMLKR